MNYPKKLRGETLDSDWPSSNTWYSLVALYITDDPVLAEVIQARNLFFFRKVACVCFEHFKLTPEQAAPPI